MDNFNQTSFSAQVGEKIRFYRKNRGMSQDVLAEAIHKTKSTLSKYENGQVAIDVDTLYDIAVALNVELFQLMDMPIRVDSDARIPGNPFSGKDSLYMYYYDGRTKRNVRTRLELKNNQAEGNQIPCYCYMDCRDLDDYVNCKFFYTGTITHYELFSYIRLRNQHNPMEQIEISIMNPFQDSCDTWGLMLAISYSPVTPFVLKVLCSDEPLSEEHLGKEALSFSKSEIKAARNLNMVLLDTEKP